MRVIIAGAGQVGVGLAKYLRAENHDVVLIDNDIDQLGNLSEQLDIQTIEGSSAYPSVLEKAGAHQADIFLAVTGNDATNIVACGIAHTIFRIPQRIVRIGSHEYLSQKYKEYLKSSPFFKNLTKSFREYTLTFLLLLFTISISYIGCSEFNIILFS